MSLASEFFDDVAFFLVSLLSPLQRILLDPRHPPVVGDSQVPFPCWVSSVVTLALAVLREVCFCFFPSHLCFDFGVSLCAVCAEPFNPNSVDDEDVERVSLRFGLLIQTV